MDIIATIYENVNTLQDRKYLIDKFIKETLPKGKITVFVSYSFWHSWYLYNIFKKQYKKIVKFCPKYINNLKSINFSDYYMFLKTIVSAHRLPSDFYYLVFDLDLLIQSKCFGMYKILYEEGLKFSSTIPTISQQIDYSKYIRFDNVCRIQSNFSFEVSYKSMNRFSLPRNSVFFCLDRKLLNNIVQKLL